MKTLVTLVMILTVSFTVTSCGGKKEEKKVVETEKTEEIKHKATAKEIKKEEVKQENATSTSDAVVKGKELFTSKACTACHTIDKKTVGPSIKDIAKVYADRKGNLVQFLKGKKEAIVDTDPAQVAVMKANLEGVLKDLKAEEYQALAAYIRSVK